MNTDLEKEVWSETALAEILGVKKAAVRRLALEEGLPAVRIQRGQYVFLSGDVLTWLAGRKSGQGASVTHAEDGLTTP